MVKPIPTVTILPGGEDLDPRTSKRFFFNNLNHTPSYSSSSHKAHIIAPATARTLKTFAGSLCSKWLIHDYKWLTESIFVGKWLPEEAYGLKNTVEPFKDKKIFVTDLFHTESQASSRKSWYQSCLDTLLVKVKRSRRAGRNTC